MSKHPKLSCWGEWVRLFSNLRFSKTQYSSAMMSKIRSVGKNIGGYILRKPNFRQKNENSKLSHSASNVKGFLNIQFVLQNIKKN